MTKITDIHKQIPNVKLYTELSTSQDFITYGKEIQNKFDLKENPAVVVKDLVRKAYNKPFLGGALLFAHPNTPEQWDSDYVSPLTRELASQVSLEEFKTILQKLVDLRNAINQEAEEYLKSNDILIPLWNREGATYTEPFPSLKRLGREGTWTLTDAQNQDFESKGYASYNHAFKINIPVKVWEKHKKVDASFEVKYGNLIANQAPYFTFTFSSDKLDFMQHDLQGYERTLPLFDAFCKKWAKLYLSALTLEEYA
jgi:hypothetical protein